MSKELTPDFSYTFDGLIWKTCPDIDNLLLAVEVRNNELHKAGFHVINFVQKKIEIHDLELTEPWWLSLVAIKGPLLFFRFYPDEQNPGISDFVVYDSTLKKETLKIRGFTLTGFESNQIHGYLSMEDSRDPCNIDLITGKISSADLSPDSKMDRNLMSDAFVNLFHPVQYYEGDKNFNVVKKFLSRINAEPCVAVDYLEFREYIIIEYYQRNNSDLVNHLLVINVEGVIIFHEIISSGLKGIGMDPYFIMNNSLVYTVDKNTIRRIVLI